MGSPNCGPMIRRSIGSVLGFCASGSPRVCGTLSERLQPSFFELRLASSMTCSGSCWDRECRNGFVGGETSGEDFSYDEDTGQTMTPKKRLKYVVSMTITTSSGASSFFKISTSFSCRCTHFVLRPYFLAICAWVCLPCVNSFQISFVCSFLF